MTDNVREWESDELTTLYGGPLNVCSRAVRPHRGLVPEVVIMEGGDGMFHLSPGTARTLAALLLQGAYHAEGVQ